MLYEPPSTTCTHNAPHTAAAASAAATAQRRGAQNKKSYTYCIYLLPARIRTVFLIAPTAVATNSSHIYTVVDGRPPKNPDTTKPSIERVLWCVDVGNAAFACCMTQRHGFKYVPSDEYPINGGIRECQIKLSYKIKWELCNTVYQVCCSRL